jgi:hypothetical protein
MTTEDKEKLVRLQLKRLPDTTQCPLCDYIGFIDKARKCRDKVICSICNHSWLDPSLQPLSALSGVSKTILQFYNSDHELWSSIWKEMWSRECPKCKSPIEKNGGCPHMTCQKCSNEFCWNCMGSYYNHDSVYCQTMEAK